MIFCTECGAKLTDGSLFCEECGAKVTAGVIAENAAEASGGTAPPAPLYQQDFDTAIPQAAAAASIKRKKFNRAFLAVAGAVIILAAAFFVLPALIPKSSGKIRPVIYVKDGSTIKFYNTFMKNPAEISSIYSDSGERISSRVSKDNNWLLYTDSPRDGALYLRNLDSEKPKNKEKSDRGIKLASDVSNTFFFTRDSKHAVYVKNDGGLYYHDTKEAFKLDSDISRDFTPRITDQDRIFYYKSDMAGSYSLYTQVVGDKNGEKVKIDSDIASPYDLRISEDGQYAAYTKPSVDNIDVYRYSIKTGEKQKLAADANHVMSIDVDAGAVLYNKKSSMNINLLEVLGIDDDLAASDATLSEPREQDYRKMQAGTFGDREVTDYDALNAAYDRYNQKIMRDRIRDELTANREVQTVDVYVNKNGQEVKLITGINSEFARVEYSSLKNGFIICNIGELRSERLTKISSITDYNMFMQNFRAPDFSEMASRLCYIPITGGDPNPFYTVEPSEIVHSLTVAESGKSLLFVSGTQNGELYYANITASGVSTPVKVDDDVSGIFDKYDDTFLYMKDVKSNIGSLYSVTGQNKKLVSHDVSTMNISMNGDDGTLSFYKDWNEGRSYGDYYLLSGEPTKISSDVSNAFYRSDKLIYLLKNFNYTSNKGDLYAYVGKSELKLLDYDVNYVS